MYDLSKLNNIAITEKRNELDITQKAISQDLKISFDEYKSIEAGELIPKKRIVKKICKYLSLDINEVYDEDFKNTVVLSFLNNKGGSGKTSVSGSLAYALSEKGFKILCIDADMQGNLTHSYNLEANVEKNFAKAIEFEENLVDHIIPSGYKNIDFVVYHPALASIEMKMFNKTGREEVLRRILKEILDKGEYDYIIIDTNPTLSMLNFNVVNVSDYCIPPLQMGAFGLEGLDILLEFIDGVIQYNPKLKGVKLVINNYDIRKNVTKKSEKWLREHYSDMLLNTIIRVDTNIELAQLEGEPVLAYNNKSKIADDVRKFANEVVKFTKNK